MWQRCMQNATGCAGHPPCSVLLRCSHAYRRPASGRRHCGAGSQAGVGRTARTRCHRCTASGPGAPAPQGAAHATAPWPCYGSMAITCCRKIHWISEPRRFLTASQGMREARTGADACCSIIHPDTSTICPWSLQMPQLPTSSFHRGKRTMPTRLFVHALGVLS